MVYVNEMIDSLVENIRKLCREKHVSITQMEDDLGFSAGLISRWSKTKTSPSFDKIVAIMDYLEITYDQLMGTVPRNEPINFSSGQNKKPDICKKILEDSESGCLDWFDACNNMPFHISFEQVFANWSSYYVHRIYYAEPESGFFFLALQYNDSITEMKAALYMLVEDGLDPKLLSDQDDYVKRLLKHVDGNLYSEYAKKKEEKMITEYMVS